MRLEVVEAKRGERRGSKRSEGWTLRLGDGVAGGAVVEAAVVGRLRGESRPLGCGWSGWSSAISTAPSLATNSRKLSQSERRLSGQPNNANSRQES